MSLTGPLVRHFSRRVSGSQRQQKANPSTSLAVERAIIDTFSRFGGSSVVIVLRRRHAPPHFHRFHTSHQLLCCHLPASGHAPQQSPSKRQQGHSRESRSALARNLSQSYLSLYPMVELRPAQGILVDMIQIGYGGRMVFFSLEMGSRMFSRRFPSAV